MMGGREGNPRGFLRPFDMVFLAYLAVETFLLLLHRERLEHWPGHLAVHGAMAAAVPLWARLARRSGNRLFRLSGDWYPALYIILIFLQLRALVPAVHPRTFDAALLQWDHRLLGGHPGAWFDPISSPLMTETFRACWLSYFILPLLLGVPLYRRLGRGPFYEAVLALMLGWLISFLGYYAVPALGPGYFPERVPAPEAVGASGLTQTVALALFAAEGRMHDIFPSGHAIIALLVLWLARRNRLRGWPILVPVVLGLLAGTVYLRYHYGVDVLAGLAVVGAVMWITPRWHRAWMQGRG